MLIGRIDQVDKAFGQMDRLSEYLAAHVNIEHTCLDSFRYNWQSYVLKPCWRALMEGYNKV
jgi:hypothetical protein